MSQKVNREPAQKVWGMVSEPPASQAHDWHLDGPISVDGAPPLVDDGDLTVGPTVVVRCPLCSSTIAETYLLDRRRRGLDPIHYVRVQYVADGAARPKVCAIAKRVLAAGPLASECVVHGPRPIDAAALLGRSQRAIASGTERTAVFVSG